MTVTCNKCGIVKGFLVVKGNQTGLYCNKCGKWIKWLTKDEIRLFNHKEDSETESDNDALGIMYVNEICELFKRYAEKHNWKALETEVSNFYINILRRNALNEN